MADFDYNQPDEITNLCINFYTIYNFDSDLVW